MFPGSLLMLSSHITLAGCTIAHPLQLVRCYLLVANHLASVTHAFIASSVTKSSCHSWLRSLQWWGNPSFAQVAAACLLHHMSCSESACAKHADQLNDMELSLGPPCTCPRLGPYWEDWQIIIRMDNGCLPSSSKTYLELSQEPV